MSLFDIVYAKVHAYKGGCRAVALRMRDMGFPNMTEDVLQKKVSTTCDTHHLRLDEFLVIMEIVDTDDFAKEIARMRVMLCIAKVVFDGVSDQEFLDLFLKSEEERGEWARECRIALQDGRICLKEFKKVEKEYLDGAAADAEVMARLKSMINPRELETLVA